MKLTEEQNHELKRRIGVYIEALHIKTEFDKHYAGGLFYDVRDFVLECVEKERDSTVARIERALEEAQLRFVEGVSGKEHIATRWSDIVASVNEAPVLTGWLREKKK